MSTFGWSKYYSFSRTLVYLFFALFREDDSYGETNNCIYILRVSDSEEGSIIRDCNFFTNSSMEESILSRVHDFEIQGRYMFATKRLVCAENYGLFIYIEGESKRTLLVLLNN